MIRAMDEVGASLSALLAVTMPAMKAVTRIAPQVKSRRFNPPPLC
jgi:hypothetical protein